MFCVRLCIAVIMSSVFQIDDPQEANRSFWCRDAGRDWSLGHQGQRTGVIAPSPSLGGDGEGNG